MIVPFGCKIICLHVSFILKNINFYLFVSIELQTLLLSIRYHKLFVTFEGSLFCLPFIFFSCVQCSSSNITSNTIIKIVLETTLYTLIIVKKKTNTLNKSLEKKLNRYVYYIVQDLFTHLPSFLSFINKYERMVFKGKKNKYENKIQSEISLLLTCIYSSK